MKLYLMGPYTVKSVDYGGALYSTTAPNQLHFTVSFVPYCYYHVGCNDFVA